MANNFAIILAGGRGRRMGRDFNKQFINIKGRPLLSYTLETFSNYEAIDGIILVCGRDEIEYCRNEIVEKYNIKKLVKFVPGGFERQDSVYNGLKALEQTPCDIVLIHDGARPFTDRHIISEGIRFAKEYGGSACGVTPKDTIKVKNTNGLCCETLDRKSLFAVQTPQCFRYNAIMECHEKLNSAKFSVTDDTMVFQHFGYEVYLYEGSYDNIKITTAEDLYMAEKIIEKRNSVKFI